MGEDQDAAGARGLDEAHRGDGLAGAGRVLEPEALVGVGIVERLGDVLVDLVGTVVVVGLGLRSASSGSLLLVVVVEVDVQLDFEIDLAVVGGLLVGLLVDREHRGRDGPRRRSSRWASASTAVSVPESAST